MQKVIVEKDLEKARILCEEIIGETEWILQISKPSAYKSYYACSVV